MHFYLHIPFCAGFCSYCDFYSVKRLSLRERYVEALCREITTCKESERGTATTVYIGGGTPSVLSVALLERVICTLKSALPFTEPEEFTIEVNPDDITAEYASGLKSIGADRISMGVQSFDNEALRWMNRRHTAEQALKAYSLLRKSGFKNISVDLIFGYSMLTDEMWLENLRRIVTLQPEHISAYQMSLEPGSLLSSMARKGEAVLHSPQRCERQYRMLQEYLSSHGYLQYEISNFAKRGRNGEYKKALHNSAYWSGKPYRGFGPGAHSYSGILYDKSSIHALRSWNFPLIKRYCSHFLSAPEYGESHDMRPICGSETLGSKEIFNETIMLRLRTCDGLNLNLLNETDSRLYEKFRIEMGRHLKMGNLVMEGDKIKIPSEKLFISDGIIRDLFI